MHAAPQAVLALPIIVNVIGRLKHSLLHVQELLELVELLSPVLGLLYLFSNLVKLSDSIYHGRIFALEHALLLQLRPHLVNLLLELRYLYLDQLLLERELVSLAAFEGLDHCLFGVDDERLRLSKLGAVALG